MNDYSYLEAIRHFNRFYTRIIGINNQYTDQTKYSSIEAQILYEISRKSNCTASYLTQHFHLDKGYLSRILKKFEKEHLIVKTSSGEDKRVSFLHITQEGLSELELLIKTSNQLVRNMISHIPEEIMDELIQSMTKIERILKEYARK